MIAGHYYDAQIKRFVLQFCAIFTGMQVSVGANNKRASSLISVPIMMGSADRVAAAIASGNTQNHHIRLPVMSANVTGLDMAKDRMKGSGTVMRGIDVPYGGDPRLDGQVVYQKMAVPYDITVELKVRTSNKDQQFQIFEQISMLFNPMMQIQATDAVFDPGKIVAVELSDITIDDNYPIGTESRICEMTFRFKIDAYIQYPAEVKQNLIRTIIARVNAVSDPDIGTILSSGKNNKDLPIILEESGTEEVVIITANDVQGV